ncbi:MAG: acyltransferase [Caldilineaceae bacterium]|nr:acyltransferase [Caldilineaceae bacterium]
MGKALVTPLKSAVQQWVQRQGKQRSFQFDAELEMQDLSELAVRHAFWLVRGLIWRLRFGHSAGMVMIASGTHIRHPRCLRVGKNFIVEDYVEIMALSRQGIVCGNNVTIGAFSTIKPSSYYGRNLGEGLRIGNNSNIGRYAYIGCSGLVTIGDNVMMGPKVSIFAENHNFDAIDRPMHQQGVTRQPVVIEHDCWLASGVTILAGVTVGRGSVVAAGSVVTQDIPPFSVAAGTPARVLRSRT